MKKNGFLPFFFISRKFLLNGLFKRQYFKFNTLIKKIGAAFIAAPIFYLPFYRYFPTFFPLYIWEISIKQSKCSIFYKRFCFLSQLHMTKHLNLIFSYSLDYFISENFPHSYRTSKKIPLVKTAI